MAHSHPTKRPGGNTRNVKLLLTAASLTATLGGWAVLAADPPPAPLPPAPLAVALPAPTQAPTLEPWPTLVPLLSVDNSVQAGPPAPVVQVAAPAPTPSLRVVTAPPVVAPPVVIPRPAAIARTRSSR